MVIHPFITLDLYVVYSAPTLHYLVGASNKVGFDLVLMTV
jgi:hypothetical protein